MSFKITRLQDDRIIVSGSDIQGHTDQIVVDGTQWLWLQGADKESEAVEAFDKAMEEFYAPLAKATDALHAAKANKVDALNYIVVQEGKAGTPAAEEILVELTHDSKILRLIAEDELAPRLIWITTGDTVSLEILAEDPTEEAKSKSTELSFDAVLNGTHSN